MLRRWLKDQAGATAIEYALIGALIAVVLVGAISSVGTSTRDMLYGRISSSLN